MDLKLLKTLAATLILGLFAAGSANAGFIMTIDEGADGVDVMSITDEGAGDAAAGAGGIAYVHLDPYDTWSFVVTAGTSYPLLGNNIDDPRLDLGVSSATSTTGSSLQISLTQTNFYGPLGENDFLVGIGGGTDGTVESCFYMDLTNSEFGTGTSLGCFTDTGFDFSSGLMSTISVPKYTEAYSLTIVTTITHTAAGITTYNAGVKISEPGTLALLGLGLAGAGLARRRRREDS